MSEGNKMAAAILGVSLVASAAIGSVTFYKAKNLENTMSVTGSAKRKVTADQVRWTAGFTRTAAAADLKSGYAQMARDTEIVNKFFKDNGIAPGQIDISPVSLEQPYLYDKNAGGANSDYVLRQRVEIKSGDVEKITSLAKDIQKLVDQGVVFSTFGLEYSYSKLSDLRVELLTDAMKDAQKRAQSIAESGGRKLGQLRTASMGVVQVMAEGNNDVSDYGSYDTSTVNKEVMVTVRGEFSLK